MRLKCLLLLVCVVLSACRPKPSATVVIDPALITLIPADTILLAGVRMEPIKSTEIYKRYVASQKLPMLDEFTRKTGLDPRKDLWEFLVAANGKDMLVMARGHFSEMGLEPRLAIEGAQRFSYKGFEMLGDEASSAVVFINSSTAVAGPTAALRHLVDARTRPDSGAPRWLLDRVNAVPSSNQIWVVGSVAGQLEKMVPKPSAQTMNFGQFLDSLKLLTAQIDLQNGIDIHAEGLCENEAGAKRLNDAMRGILGLGRISTPQSNPEMLRVYDGVKVLLKEKAVLVDVNWPLSLVDELTKLMPGR
jgi:hypothetical protein